MVPYRVASGAAVSAFGTLSRLRTRVHVSAQPRLRTDRLFRREGILTSGWSGQMKRHAAVAHAYLVGRNGLLGRSSLRRAAADVELRSVPGALHRPTRQNAVRQRPAPVSASIVEGDVSPVC